MNAVTPMKSLALAALALLLGACQSLSPSNPPAVYKRTAWEHLQAGCQGRECPLVNIDTVHFADEPALNRLIDQGLLELTREAEGMPLPASLESHERDFLAGAKPGWSSYLQAKVLEQNNGRILVELSSYRFTGGAHGMPRRAFIDFDRRRQKALELRDLLLGSRRGSEPEEAWLASSLAAACLGGDHLWRDLGLESRESLKALLLHNFPSLAERNVKNMRWKKFLYKQLCEQDGGYVCRAPSCEQCPSHHDCFGAEV